MLDCCGSFLFDVPKSQNREMMRCNVLTFTFLEVCIVLEYFYSPLSVVKDELRKEIGMVMRCQENTHGKSSHNNNSTRSVQ